MAVDCNHLPVPSPAVLGGWELVSSFIYSLRGRMQNNNNNNK